MTPESGPRVIYVSDANSSMRQTSDGHPILPLRNRHDYDMLAGFARMCGWQVQESLDAKGVQRGMLRDATVVGLGETTWALASLYADLTSRKVVHIRHHSELGDQDNTEVLLTLCDKVNTSVLEWASSVKGDACPGIICAIDEDHLYRQILLNAAAAHLPISAEPNRIDLFPMIPVGHMLQPGIEMLGANATAAEIRIAISNGCGVLAIMTHSDGVDAHIGAGLVLCSMDDYGMKCDASNAPRCRITGFCHRKECDWNSARESGALVFPDAIAAGVVVLDTCCGFMAAGSVLSGQWGLVSRLTSSGRVGAVVTTWETAFTTPAHSFELSRRLVQGIPVGRALAQFMREPQVHELERRMCVFGEPSTRLVPTRHREAENDGKNVFVVPAMAHGELVHDLAVLRAGFKHAQLSGMVHSDSQQPLLRALNGIETYDDRAYCGISVEDHEPAICRRMREAILDLLCIESGQIFASWVPFAAFQRMSMLQDRYCGCGQKKRSLRAVFNIPGAADRVLETCPHCGVVTDAPVDSDLRLECIAGHVYLTGSMPTLPSLCAVVISSKLRSENIMHRFAIAEPRNASTIHAPLPAQLPVGPVRVSLCMLWGARYSVSSVMIRKD